MVIVYIFLIYLALGVPYGLATFVYTRQLLKGRLPVSMIEVMSVQELLKAREFNKGLIEKPLLLDTFIIIHTTLLSVFTWGYNPFTNVSFTLSIFTGEFEDLV